MGVYFANQYREREWEKKTVKKNCKTAKLFAIKCNFKVNLNFELNANKACH